jgi:hypothetical protein
VPTSLYSIRHSASGTGHKVQLGNSEKLKSIYCPYRFIDDANHETGAAAYDAGAELLFSLAVASQNCIRK